MASTQRILVEDLPPVIVEFERCHPHVHLRFLELRNEQVPPAVQAGEADLGLTPERPADPWLAFEPTYELDLLLVTPKDHPLARRRRFRPRDLLGFPLVNAPTGVPDPAITAALEKLGGWKTQPRRVEAYYTAVIRRYVELGFGIGLVVGLPSHTPPTNLYERSLSRHFGRLAINLVWRKGIQQNGSARAPSSTPSRPG